MKKITTIIGVIIVAIILLVWWYYVITSYILLNQNLNKQTNIVQDNLNINKDKTEQNNIELWKITSYVITNNLQDYILKFHVLGINNDNFDYLYEKNWKFYIKLWWKFKSDWNYNWLECSYFSWYNNTYDKEYDKIISNRIINKNKRCIIAEKLWERYFLIYDNWKLQEYKIEYLWNDKIYWWEVAWEWYFPKYCLYVTYNDNKTIVYVDWKKIWEYNKIYDSFEYSFSFWAWWEWIIINEDYSFIWIKENKYYLVFNWKEKELDDKWKIEYFYYNNWKVYLWIWIYENKILTKLIEYEFDWNNLDKKEKNYIDFYNKYSKSYPNYNFYNEYNWILIIWNLADKLPEFDSEYKLIWEFYLIWNNKKEWPFIQINTFWSYFDVVNQYNKPFIYNDKLELLFSYNEKNWTWNIWLFYNLDEDKTYYINNKVDSLSWKYECIWSNCNYICNYEICYDNNLNKTELKLIYNDPYVDFAKAIIQDNNWKYILYSWDQVINIDNLKIIKDTIYIIELWDYNLIIDKYRQKTYEVEKEVAKKIIEIINNKDIDISEIYNKVLINENDKTYNISYIKTNDEVYIYNNWKLEIIHKKETDSDLILVQSVNILNWKLIAIIKEWNILFIYDKDNKVNMNKYELEGNYWIHIWYMNWKVVIWIDKDWVFELKSFTIWKNIYNDYLIAWEDDNLYICR